MRTPSTMETLVAAARGQTTAVKVEVQDSASNWRDLGSLFGRDYVSGVELTTTSDDQISQASVRLLRAVFKDNLAPLAGVGRIAALAAQPLLRPSAAIRISSKMLPLGSASTAGTWRVIFQGYIERVSAPGDEITLSCRDKASLLQRRWIETERVYGVWDASRVVKLNTVVVPKDLNPNTSATTQYMKCTTAGTTGSSQPTWPAKGSGSTVSDGTVVWTEQTTYKGTPAETLLQMLLDDTLGAGVVTLYCPVSPAWYIRDYNQKKQSLWDALRTITDQIGWDLRYIWNSSTSAFELTFFEVDRAAAAVYELGPAKYRDPTVCDQDLEGIRNAVVVKYYDRSSLQFTDPTPATEAASDATSISAYGRQWMEVAEDATSQISSSTEAATLAQAILADLKDPLVTLTLQVEHINFLELHDVVTVDQDGLRLASDLDLGIIGIKHTFGPDVESGGMTELTFFGTPIAGRSKWHGLAAQPGSAPQNRLQGPRAPQSVTAAGTIEGGRLTFTPPTDPRERWEASDLHISDTSGFTPSESTRYATSKSGFFDVAGLDPLRTYYYRVVHRDRQNNLSPYSAEASFQPKIAHTTAEVWTAVTSDSTYANDTVIAFDNTQVNDAHAWSSDTFTAPRKGFYRLHVQLEVTGGVSGDRLRIYALKNSSTKVAVSPYAASMLDSGGSNYIVCPVLDQVVELDEGDTVSFYPLHYGGGGTKTLRKPDPATSPFHPGSFVEITFLYPA